MSDIGRPNMAPTSQPEPLFGPSFGEEHRYTQSLEAQAAEEARVALDRLNESDRSESRTRTISSIGLMGAVAGGIGVVATGHADEISFTQQTTFSESLQRIVNNVDDGLEVVGGASLAVATLAIAAIKLGAKRDRRLAVIDRWSSREMSEDRLNPNRKLPKRILESTFAGRVPVMGAFAVYLTVLAGAVGTAVSEGPQRPIVTALEQLAPGESFLLNYDSAMPMTESSITRPLANRYLQEAQDRGVQASVLDLNLGQMQHGEQVLSDLSLGIDMPAGSLLDFSPQAACEGFPIAVDSSASIGNGTEVLVNGVKAEVVQQVEGVSAINRVGIVMDQEAMAKCLNKSEDIDSPVHALIVDASTTEAKSILDTVNIDQEVSAIVPKEAYLKSSLNFWESNVKPITSVMALFAAAFAITAYASKVREGLVRNRREWAGKLAGGTSVSVLRATESMRVAKDGVLASIVGGGLAMFSVPIVLNTLESGIKASVGLRELFIGASVGVAGSLIGAAKSLINPKKVIRVEESIRG